MEQSNTDSSRQEREFMLQCYRSAYTDKFRLIRAGLTFRVTGLAAGMRRIKDRVVLWPAFQFPKDEPSFHGVVAKANHYLNNLDFGISYFVRGEDGLRFCEARIGSDKPAEGTLVDEAWALSYFRQSRYCALWQADAVPKMVSLRPYIYFVADITDSPDAVEWLRMLRDIYTSQGLPVHSAELPALSVGSCAVIGSGPSCELFHSEADRYDAWISLNFAVCDDRIRLSGKPFAVCALDPLFFGPYPSVKPFWEKAGELLASTPAVLVTALKYAPYIELNMPQEIKRKCHYVRTLGLDSCRACGSARGLCVPMYGNVLTDLALPLAAAVSRKVVVYGCDGRPQGMQGSFAKNREMGHYDDVQRSERKTQYTTAFVDAQIDRFCMTTRVVADECRRRGARLIMRRPTYTVGLQHLEVAGEPADA